MVDQNVKSSSQGITAVEASAGTGKTYTLSQYYLKLLLNSEETSLKNIIAITFTKKATKEMKERIIQFIKEAAFGTIEAQKILGKDNIPASVKKKASHIMDFLIKNYNFFQVQTIDSFVNTILQSCAIKLNLSSKYETKTDNKDYLTYGLESVLDKALTDRSKKDLFDEFLNKFMKAENKISWFPKQKILEVMETLNNNANNFGKDFIKLDSGNSGEIIELKNSIHQDFDELLKILPKDTNGTFKNSFTRFMQKIRHLFPTEDIPNGFGKESFPVNKGGAVSQKVSALWDTLRHKINNLCKKEAYSYFNCYIDIFSFVHEEFRKVTDKEDILFLNEFNKRASKLFKSELNILPELYYRLATRFKHFLIDEFQDTSRLQWENLKQIVTEILSSGGNLFYVGDKKQAIYSFRGGDAELFDEVINRFHNIDSKTEKLTLNYRSQKEIVEFNNAIFSQDNLNVFLNFDKKIELSDEYKESILHVFSDAKQEHLDKNTKGYVKTEFIDSETEDTDDIVKDKTLKIIKDCLKRGYEKKDLAVLCRTNSDVEIVTNWLLEHKYAVESEKTLSLRENTVIKELVSFLMYLNSPIDNTSFASFILGEVFLKASKIPKEEIENFIFHSNDKISKLKNFNIYKSFRDKYPEIWEKYFSPFFASVGMLPFYELVISVIAKFNILGNFKEHQIFLSKFLELIKERSKETTGLQHFIEYFVEAEEKDLFIESSKTDAINVLTMHGSKGLEYPVVIIPYLEVSVKRDSEFYGSTANGMVMVKLKEKYDNLAEELKVYSMKNRKENLINELNTAYVALTRAEHELYIMHSKKAGSHNNLAKVLIGEKDIEAGKKERFEKKSEKKEPEIDITVPKYSSVIETLKDEYVDKDELDKREEFLYGRAIHLALSFIGNIEEKDIENSIKNAITKTEAVYGNKLSQVLEKKIQSILNNNDLKPYFFSGDSQISCEKDIVTKNGETRVIDRLIVSSKEAVIIDFKSTKNKPQEHIKQVQEYKTIVSEIYPEKQVKGYVLYLDSETIINI
ncbi:UvrD-helicase domain-containing protein [Elusimicrobiota bacterium]